MNGTSRSAMSVVVIVLLLAILGTLITIALRGIRVEHAGTVALTGMYDRVELRMPDPVTLRMPEAVEGTISSAEFPVQLQFGGCPDCGGTMVPIRWDLWTGEIEWRCSGCEATTTVSSESP